MNSPSLWFIYQDPAIASVDFEVSSTSTILDPDNKRIINQKFQGAPLAFAVALLPSITKLPPNTPVMWTRGLQPDGTWREDSPFGHWGGHVVYASGEMTTWSRGESRSRLTKWGTDEPTKNIFEALPPGTHISEYIPPPKVARYLRWQLMRAQLLRIAAGLGPLLLMLACSLGVAHPRIWGAKRIGSILLGMAFATWFWFGVLKH